MEDDFLEMMYEDRFYIEDDVYRDEYEEDDLDCLDCWETIDSEGLCTCE